MNRIRKNLIKAAIVANESQHSFKVGAYSPSWFVSGVNSYRSHPKSLARYNNLHAEMDLLINNSVPTWVATEVFVARLRKDGSLGMAMPCVYCMTMLIESNVDKVHWTINEKEYGSLKLKKNLLRVRLN